MFRSQAAAYARAAKALNQVDVQGLSLAEAALTSLALANQPGLKEFQAQLMHYLQQQVNKKAFFKEGLYTTLPVITALYASNKLAVKGEHLALVIKQLIAHEHEAGGPYVVHGEPGTYLNALAAVFARLAAKPLPRVEAFLQNGVKTGQRTKEPVSPITLGFLLQYAGQIQPRPQPTRPQRPNGLWPGDAHCPDALATAIQLYYHSPSANAAGNVRRSKQVAHLAKALFAHQAGSIAARLQKLVDATLKADPHFETTLLAYFFGKPFHAPQHQWQQLGAASVCGWIAYSLYDDLIDDEGKNEYLPLANIAQRQCLNLLWQTLPDNGFRAYATRLLDTMDTANTWELANCRFLVRGQIITIGQLPGFGRANLLADRSLGHALAPLAALWHIGSPARRNAERALRHYLIARQLADDLHDWQKDLHAGHISYVVAVILRDHGAAAGSHYLPTLHAALQHTFNVATLPKVCSKMVRHVEQSRLALAALPFTTPKEMLALLDRLVAMATQPATAEARNAAFVSEFQSLGNDRVVKVEYGAAL